MNGNIKDHGNFKHGLTEHRLYRVWAGMKNRCKTNKSNGEYYHQRGIIVCQEWHKFINFYNWSIVNGYKKGLTIDRIDNNGNYEPLNCRFTTYSKQNSNKRKYQSMPRNNLIFNES